MAGQLSTWLTFTIIAAALGSGFQHGYHTGVINVPEKVTLPLLEEEAS